MRSGDSFLVQDQQGQRFEAILKSFDRNSLLFTPQKPVEIPPASSMRIEILQALPKQKALDFILQKTTELGVSRLDVFCGMHSPKTILATKYESKELEPNHGWPLRLVITHLYGWKSAKWIKEIQFTSTPMPGFWEVRGYHMNGDPWKQERFS